ncbi:MAG: hypothetical protein J5877_02845 [Clostridia bacterium]|nr:hypothetical protein [Clostridia bacterium]
MKKTLAIILITVMLLSAISVSAYAANNGPANVEYAFISVFYAAGNEPDSQPYGHIYSNYTTINNAVPGVTYDKASNTLTLNNYKNAKAAISANMMGDNFKINVIGDCEIAEIMAYGDGWGGSVTITGTGTLTVNKSGICDNAISLYAESTASSLHIDSSVTVILYGNEGVFYSNYNAVTSTGAVVTAGNGQNVFTIKKEGSSYRYRTALSAFLINNPDGTRYAYYKTTRSGDPDGIYGTCVMTTSAGKKTYSVTKYFHSDTYGVDLPDRTFNEQYGNEWGEVEFTREQFDELGFQMTVTGQQPSHVFFDDGDWYSGYLLTNSADPDGVYMINCSNYSYTNQNDFSTYTFKGTIYRILLNAQATQYYKDTSFTPIEIGTDNEYGALPAGYVPVAEDEYQELYIQGNVSEIQGTVFTDSSDKWYLVHDEYYNGNQIQTVYDLVYDEDIDFYFTNGESNAVGIDDLTIYLTYEPCEGQYNYSTSVKNFTFQGSEKNGFITVDGKTYYYLNGVMQKGLKTIDGKKYYFGSDGVMYVKRLISVSGKKYYMGADGAAYTKKLISVNGKKYYMGSDGVAYTNKLISVNGKKYYMGKDGAAYTSKLISVDGKKYYMGKDGVAYTSKLASIDGKKYYFGKDGVAYKSKLISVSGKKYYIGKDCVAYKSKFASLSGKKYYFGSDCAMYKSKTFSVSGVKWRADSNGVCKKV